MLQLRLRVALRGSRHRARSDSYTCWRPPVGSGDADQEHIIESETIDRRVRRTRLDARLRRAFPTIQFALDASAWAVAIPVTTILRYDFRLRPIDGLGVTEVVVAAIVLQGIVGLKVGLYRRRYHYGSFDEVRVLGISMAVVAVALFVVAQIGGGGLVPRTVPLLAAGLALVIAVVVRYTARLLEDGYYHPSTPGVEPIVVFGAGHSGAQISRGLLRSGESPYRPVAFLDDDSRKARTRVNGVRVRGTGADALEVARQYGATAVLVAVPSISGDRLREVSTPLLEAGLKVLVLPRFSEVFDALGESVDVADIRPMTIADLLGRHPTEVDLQAIAGYITGRRVLVTGAGGSIGSELCRQLHHFDPAALYFLDRDESGLHQTQLSIEGRALLDAPTLLLADIRDRDRIFELFQAHRPDVVFHAAALKHQPLLEFNPSEAWKSNVVGTHNVLEAAETSGVRRFVNVSTDKAADPIGVLGYSKRICERITADTAKRTGLPYVSVRFGNVLGSRGSVLGVFEEQVRAGGPVTVTDADVTRFFMTVEEAVALTIQAGAIGAPGEVLVLDMGEPVRIEDVARRIIQQSGRDIAIVHTGLRPGEKLHEVLFGRGERDERRHHPLISQVSVPPLSFSDARAACSVDGRLSMSPAALEIATEWKATPPSVDPTPSRGGTRPADDSDGG
jgi:FlaA1/EpsC-like NDP-sugar epimerase